MKNGELLRVFTYGTLKRGQRNHHYCAGFASVRAATVRGLLYQHRAGYPLLEVHADDVIAVGTEDAAHDLKLQMRTPVPGRMIAAPGEVAEVTGELYEFTDALERLRVLDELEGFEPGRESVWYTRVLVVVRLAESGALTTAWAYTLKHEEGAQLLGSTWPKEG